MDNQNNASNRLTEDERIQLLREEELTGVSGSAFFAFNTRNMRCKSCRQITPHDLALSDGKYVYHCRYFGAEQPVT